MIPTVVDSDWAAGLAGLKGHTYYADTDTHTGTWCKVKAVGTAAAVINAIIIGGATLAFTLPLGFEVEGYITSVDLTSGAVLLYKA